MAVAERARVGGVGGEGMLTVLGKLRDTERYLGLPGYNVLANIQHWTPEINQRWLMEAVARGDGDQPFAVRRG